MWNWAGHPQIRGDYSLFAFAGRCLLGMLIAGCMVTTVHANTAESDSILASEPEAGTVTEESATEAAPAEAADEGSAPSAVAPAATMTKSGPALNTSVPLRYVVKKGDTLWDIADYFLKEPWKWPELWYGNPNIKNPHLIYPGDVLFLTYVDGKPRLSHEPPTGVEKLSPRIREEALQEAIPTIPGDAIRAFLMGPRVVGAEELEAAPYIVEFGDEHLIGGAGIPAYAKGIKQGDVPNHVVVRKGEAYHDPETKELLGYEATYIGTSSLRTPGNPARINMDTSVREVMIGDRLLPQDASSLPDPAYYPHAPEPGMAGYIIAVTGGVSNISQYQIVTLNKGARDGLEVGHVFSIYQTGRQVKDPYGSASATVTLPDEKAGLLMVFKTYERVSYALVMKSTRSIHLLDKFRSPDSP
jgi:LysM repeat protein